MGIENTKMFDEDVYTVFWVNWNCGFNSCIRITT